MAYLGSFYTSFFGFFYYYYSIIYHYFNFNNVKITLLKTLFSGAKLYFTYFN
jgi:hypothetical protein